MAKEMAALLCLKGTANMKVLLLEAIAYADF